jgi:hypothetical protein
MAELDPAIHDSFFPVVKSWMLGTRPGKTKDAKAEMA